MGQFNIKKFLQENKLTENSKRIDEAEVIDRVDGWAIYKDRDDIEAENQSGHGSAWVEKDDYNFWIETSRGTELPDDVYDAIIKWHEKIFPKQKYLHEGSSADLNESMTTYKALRGGTVDFTTINKDGTVQIFFDNGNILEFSNDGVASILKR